MKEMEKSRRSLPVEGHVAQIESALGVKIAVVRRLAGWKSKLSLSSLMTNNAC